MTDNHIRVTLDFTPVAERLPETFGEYQVIDRSKGYSIERDYFFPSDGGGCGKMNFKGVASWTHWAEIPTIKENDG